MKRSRIFLALTLAAILFLLAVALPASPALAAADIELDPEEGEIGDKIEVIGDGFKKSTDLESYRVYIFFSPEKADEGDDIEDLDIYHKVKSKSTDSTGDFETYFNVPSRLTTGDEDEDVKGGTYYVYTSYKSDGDDIQTVNEFTVIAGTIKLDIKKGTVGTEVKITGAYFSGRDDITVTFDDDKDDDKVDIESGDTDTDRDGDFTCTILVPESTAGEHTITVEDEHDHTASATFTVEPEITISPASGAAGDRATVNGTGFGGRKDVTVTFNGAQVFTARSDSVGSFNSAFTVPAAEAGAYAVVVEDEDGNEATANFSVAAGVSLGTVTSEDSPGYVGMEMTMSGTGFLPSTRVTITYATTPVTVATTTTDANGAFLATFTIPQSEGGVHTITASDGTNSLSSTFVMESTPPPAPQPLLPETGIKAGQPVRFEWEDVTDDSLPVTYTLQIAKDEAFTSMVLEKTGLTKSEYTIPEAGKLAAVKKEAPYYWRVRAVDGASNVGEWTGVGTFYVSGFSFPGMSVHLWWGLGVGGAIALGYYLGRRRAYYY